MSRVAFRQSDVQRIIRAAECEGAMIEVDIRTLNFKIIPGANRQSVVDKNATPAANSGADDYVPDGKENWDED